MSGSTIAVPTSTKSKGSYRMGRGFPYGETIDHHVRKQAVGEAGEGQHEDRDRAKNGAESDFFSLNQTQNQAAAVAGGRERRYDAREREPFPHRLADERRSEADERDGERHPEKPQRDHATAFACSGPSVRRMSQVAPSST
jgi:hypothetical protein